MEVWLVCHWSQGGFIQSLSCFHPSCLSALNGYRLFSLEISLPKAIVLVCVCARGRESCLCAIPSPFLKSSLCFSEHSRIPRWEGYLERFSFLDPSLPLPGAVSRGGGHHRWSRDGTDQGRTDGSGEGGRIMLRGSPSLCASKALSTQKILGWFHQFPSHFQTEVPSGRLSLSKFKVTGPKNKLRKSFETVCVHT